MDFHVEGKNFIKDGKPVKLISGAVHYFRNMPDTWDDMDGVKGELEVEFCDTPDLGKVGD